MRYRCTGCETEFEASEARCPECFKQTTVVSADRAAAGASKSSNLMYGPGILVTVARITPLVVMNGFEWRQGWWFTFLVALGGFGAGHAFNYWWASRSPRKGEPESGS